LEKFSNELHPGEQICVAEDFSNRMKSSQPIRDNFSEFTEEIKKW
jgi:hypothetical protein